MFFLYLRDFIICGDTFYLKFVDAITRLHAMGGYRIERSVRAAVIDLFKLTESS